MIYYIGYYSNIDNIQNRNVSLAATNKMRYIIDKFVKKKIPINIISLAMTNDLTPYSSSVERLDEFSTLIQFRTFGRRNILTKGMDLYFSKIQLFLYLMKHVKSEDILLVYHSSAYCKLIPFIKRIKKCKLILEVEEIYADVNGDKRLRKREQIIGDVSDSFLFSTELLSHTINKKNKPYVIIHGTYQVEPDKKYKFNDGKIHCVYAGTFDPRKGGAIAAAAALHLDSKYHIHIIGFGSEDNKKSIKELIAKFTKTTDCTLTYDGLLSGEDYIKFIQSCDIGLSTQNPNAEFNDTSFPSKVLSYMMNGLRVVSIKIKTLETSSINDLLYYYEEDTPLAIANAIKRIDMTDCYDSRVRLKELDEEFCRNIQRLITNEGDND